MTARGVVVICVKVRYLNSHDNWHDFKTVCYRFLESERGKEIRDWIKDASRKSLLRVLLERV